MANFELTGKVYFITGGATGLGALLADEALKLGAKFKALLDVAETQGKETERSLTAKYGAEKAWFIKCDITDEDQLSSAYSSVIDKHKQIDVIVNNAGIMNDSRNTFKKAIEVNYIALVDSTLKALEHMRVDRGGAGGVILNVSSVLGACQPHPLPIYGGAKAAVLQFSNLLGMEPHYSRTNVRVITMCFGATDTKLLHNPGTLGFDPETCEFLEEFMKQQYIQRPETAVKGTLEAIKRGASGSTWLAMDGEPVRDITSSVRQSYQNMMSASGS